jgi:hypothetical protein
MCFGKQNGNNSDIRYVENIASNYTVPTSHTITAYNYAVSSPKYGTQLHSIITHKYSPQLQSAIITHKYSLQLHSAIITHKCSL